MNPNLHTIETFAKGFLSALKANNLNPASTDEWIELAGYDTNLCGADYSAQAPEGGLLAVLYPAGWQGELPDPVSTHTITL